MALATGFFFFLLLSREIRGSRNEPSILIGVVKMVFKLKLKVPTESKASSPSGGEPKLKLKVLKPSAAPRIKIRTPSAPGAAEASQRREALPSAELPKKKLKLSLGRKESKPLPPVAPPVLAADAAEPAVRPLPKVRVKPTRVPGDGYDSEAPDVEDDPLIEQGIVVRFLDDANLDAVHNAVDSADLSDINVKWLTRERAIVTVQATLYSAVLLDLPTLTEVYKTIDKKNIFKALDVCQILLVLRQIDPRNLNVERDFELSSERLHVHPMYRVPNTELKPLATVYKDGVQYPFEDVHRRFKPRKLDHRVLEDIDAKVDELIRLDNDAEEVQFEVIDLKKNHKVMQRHGYDLSNRSTPVGSPGALDAALRSDAATGTEDEMEVDDPQLEDELAKALANDEDKQEGEVLLELEGAMGANAEVEDEEDEDDDDRAEVDDDDEDDDDGDDDDDDGDEDAGEDDVVKADKQHAKLLEEEISDLEKVVEKHRIGLDTATHKMMKMKFQTSYRTLKASLDAKKAELGRIAKEQQSIQNKQTQALEQLRGNERAEDDEDDDEDDDDKDEDDDKDADKDDDDDIDGIDDLF